jgi:hypothetical protein
MWRLSFCLALAGGTLSAQSADRVLAYFFDGTAVEIHSEATGSTPLSSLGSIGIGPGVGKQDLVNRVVVDRDNNVLFAYNLEAARGASPDVVAIRIEPLSPATETGMLARRSDSRFPKVSGAHIPTVAAVREFAAVKIGEVVTLDILFNPSTGEKIYDVLRPTTGGEPGQMGVTTRQSRDEISLKEIAVKLNNRVVQAPASWMIGAAVRIDIPGHGAYVVAVHEPHVPPIYAFKAIAHADGKILSWMMDGDYVEIASSSNVLTQAANGVLWLYHDARYRSQDQPNSVRLQTADTVDWLIPKN